MACDVDVRASLLQNIVVVGNTSLTKGLTERLDVELAGLLPSVSYYINELSNEADKVAKDQDPFTYDTL
jgi:actin-related protein